MIKRFNKLLLILFLVTTSIICISCSEEIKKINVEFIVDEASYNVEIDNGSILTYDIVPVENINYILGLYYDESYEKSYNYEKITTQEKIYVKYEDLTPYIAEVINSINTYCETLEYEHIKYSYMFIVDEISKAIEMMESANNKENIDIIKQNCISEINNLILTEEEYSCILESYSTWEFYYENIDNPPTIKYYLGKYDNKHFTIVSGSYAIVWIPEEIKYYHLYIDLYHSFFLEPLPEFIGVSYNGGYYSLGKSTDTEIFGDNVIQVYQAIKIYDRYLILRGF